jgi:hypothetical protein
MPMGHHMRKLLVAAVAALALLATVYAGPAQAATSYPRCVSLIGDRHWAVKMRAGVCIQRNGSYQLTPWFVCGHTGVRLYQFPIGRTKYWGLSTPRMRSGAATGYLHAGTGPNYRRAFLACVTA